MDYGQRVLTIYYPFGDRHVCPAEIPPLAFDKHVVMIEQHSRPYLSPILSDHHPAIYGEARGPVPRLAGQAGMHGHLFLSSSALSQSPVESFQGIKIAILGKADFHRRPFRPGPDYARRHIPRSSRSNKNLQSRRRREKLPFRTLFRCTPIAQPTPASPKCRSVSNPLVQKRFPRTVSLKRTR